jgi:glucose-1-phosphate adenylyltransferase
MPERKDMMRNVVCFVLGGGRGTRLYPLTKFRSKPAVPLAGRYRLIDIPISNCLNSGLNRVYVLTQFMSVSLHRHIRQTYNFDRFSGGFVELLAAQQTADKGEDWYEGTADAVRKNLRYIQQYGVEYVLILSGDQLYRMDFAEMIATHQESGAAVTIAAMPVSREDASSLGVMRVDDGGRVNGFVEKPQNDEELDLVRMDPAWIDAHGVESRGRECLASMGIYLFNRDLLVEALTLTDYQDFGREVFPAAFRSKHVQVHLFDNYWEDIGTIRAFYEANLSLTRPNAPFELGRPGAPIYTRARALPATRFDGAQISGSLVADGCVIAEGAVIENSIVGLRSQIGPNVTIRNSVLMGCDYFETPEELRENEAEGRPPMGIGAGSFIESAIIDKNGHIGRNVRIVNEAGIDNTPDANDCMVVDGIPVMIKNGSVPDGWTLDQLG